ncbi:MAG: SDR family NAD(P)-dependent oxidoreductase [Deltaproteobacteria bacterium]|nr:SDR family NAD(P)-dependent oxidoreductase [Deltaproteobacteria bacterium]
MSRPTHLLASKRRILVTGASRGIGAATARLLAHAGHRVILAARSRPALESLANELADHGAEPPEILVLDVTDADDVARAIAVATRSEAIDVLVNNAGRCTQRLVLERSLEDMNDEMRLDYWGAVHTTRAILPHFLARRGGAIVNVSSLLGSVGCPTTANYSAAKAALEAWTHAMRGELAPYGIELVVFVAPHTDTDAGRATRFDGVASLPVEHTARGLVRAIDRRPRRASSSPVYEVLLRLAAWFPAFMERRLAVSVRSLIAS